MAMEIYRSDNLMIESFFALLTYYQGNSAENNNKAPDEEAKKLVSEFHLSNSDIDGCSYNHSGTWFYVPNHGVTGLIQNVTAQRTEFSVKENVLSALILIESEVATIQFSNCRFENTIKSFDKSG